MGAGCSRHDSVLLGAIMQDVNAYDQSPNVANISSSRQFACKNANQTTINDCTPDIERRGAGQDQLASPETPATDAFICTHSTQTSTDDNGVLASSEHHFILYPNHHHLETVPEDDTMQTTSEGGIAAPQTTTSMQFTQQPWTEVSADDTRADTAPDTVTKECGIEGHDVASNKATTEVFPCKQACVETVQCQSSNHPVVDCKTTTGTAMQAHDDISIHQGSGSCTTSAAAAEALLPFLADPVQLRCSDEVFVAKAIGDAKKLPSSANSIITKSDESLPPLPKQPDSARNATCAPNHKPVNVIARVQPTPDGQCKPLGKDQVAKARKPLAGGQVASRKKPAGSKSRSNTSAASDPHSPGPLLSRLSYNSIMSDACEPISGEVLGFSPPCYPAPDPSKQVPLEEAVPVQRAARRSSPSLRQGLPEECSYHSSVASELGEALDLSELSASLPPSQFGTRQATRQPSYVFDCKDMKSHGYHVHEGVDPLLAAEAMEKLAHQQMLHPEVSQTSVASTSSSVIALKASLVLQQQQQRQQVASSAAQHPPGQRGTVRRKKASQHGRPISHGRSASAMAGPPAVTSSHRHSREDDEGELDEPPTTGPAVTQHASCTTTPLPQLPDVVVGVLLPCDSVQVAGDDAGDDAAQQKPSNEPAIEQTVVGDDTQMCEQVESVVAEEAVMNPCNQLVLQQVDEVVEGLLSDIAGQLYNHDEPDSEAFAINVWAADEDGNQFQKQDSQGQPCAESVETNHQFISSGPTGSTVLQASVRLVHQYSGNQVDSNCSTVAYQHCEQQRMPSGFKDTARDQLLSTTMAFCDHKDACTHLSLEELLPTRCFLNFGDQTASDAFQPTTGFYNTTALSYVQQPCFVDTLQSTEGLVPAEEDSSWLVALLPPSRLTLDGTSSRDTSSSSSLPGGVTTA